MKKNLTFYSVLFIIFLILQRGSGLFTKLILANSITPYEYGLITLIAFSLPALFQILICLNFHNILSHSINGREYFGFAIIFSLVMGLIISLVLLYSQNIFFDYLNISSEYRQLFYFAIIISMFSMGIVVDFQGFLTGLRLYSMPGIIVAIPSLARLGFLLVLFMIGEFCFETIILFFAISNAFPLIYLFLSRKRRFYLSYIKSIKIPPKKMLAFGTALFIVGSYSTIGIILIKIVISHNLGIVWQGYFDVSLTLASIVIFFLGTMNFIAVPEATNSNKESIHHKSELGEITRLLFSFLIFFFIVMYFYSEFIARIFFSEEYIIASEYCWILVVGYIFLYIQNYLANLNISYAKTPKEYLTQAIFPLLLLPLFFYFTDFMIEILKQNGFGNGFLGPYISYCLLAMVFTFITIFYSKDLTHLNTFLYKSEKLIISFAITFGILFLLHPPALIGILGSFIIFIILLAGSGYLEKNQFLDIIK